MGIRENYENLKKSLEYLGEYKSEYISGENGGKPYLISNLDLLRKGIDLLSDIDFLNPYVSILMNESAFYDTFKVKENFTSSDHTIITHNIRNLEIGIRFLLEYFDFQTSQEKESESISVKLPELNNFDELSKISNELKKAIELPIIDSKIENGKSEILTAERGSIWLIIGLGSLAAVRLVAAIANAAISIRKIYSPNICIFGEYNPQKSCFTLTG